MNILNHTYRVNEIFYSLQGEGQHAGTAAVFIRLSGCNLKCPFCDTDFHTYKEMSAQEILDEVNKLSERAMVVITGGEPSIQLDQNLLYYLRHRGKYSHYIAVETNGTHKLPDDIDWITLSPKSQWQKTPIVIKAVSEIKVVMDEDTQDVDLLRMQEAYHNAIYFVQPCDTGDKERNEKINKRCVDFIKANPQWKISLQQQKILNIR